MISKHKRHLNTSPEKKPAKSISESERVFDDLTDALYDRSSVKGLDMELLRANRKRIEEEEKKKQILAKKIEKSQLGALQDTKPTQFKTNLARQVFHIMMEDNSESKRSRKSFFIPGRMIFQFDIHTDFFSPSIKEQIPSTILQSVDNSEDRIELFPLNMGTNETFRRVTSSFDSYQKQGKKKIFKIKKPEDSLAKPISIVKDINNDFDDDIFEGIGAYTFKPQSENLFRGKQTSSTDKKEKKSIFEIHQANREEGEIKKDKSYHERKKHRRKKYRDYSDRNRKDESERYHSDSDSRRHRKRSRNNSEEKRVEIKTKAMPAEMLASEAKKNLAPRTKVSIYKRIEEEMNEDEGLIAKKTDEKGKKQKVVQIGLARAFKTVSDPYDINGFVDYGTSVYNDDSDDEEVQERLRKQRKFGFKQPSRAGMRNIQRKKLDKEWTRIQGRLKE